MHPLGLFVATAIVSPCLLGRLSVQSFCTAVALQFARKRAGFQGVPRPACGRLSPEALQKVTEFVTAEPGADLTVTNLAALANLSAYHFSRLFKAATGRTVHQYVLEQRLQRGRQLVAQSDLPITRIAVDLGFADEGHFIRHFKRRYGRTPGEIRRSIA